MNTTELVCRIAEQIIYVKDDNEHMGMQEFDWIQGVGIYGVMLAYQATGNKEYLDFLTGWCDKYLARYYDKKTVNTTAPFLTAIDLYEITGREAYRDICFDVAEYLISEAPITIQGGLEHTVIQPVPGFHEQMWADTLFMAGLFLVKMSKYDEKYLSFALKQFTLHNKVLFDESTKLYYHGYSCSSKDNLSAIHWGRANAWMIISNTTVIELLGDFPQKNTLCDYVKKHAEGLSAVMREGGSFGTVMDDASSYDETSAGAGIAAGIKKAVKLGIIDDNYNRMYDKILNFTKSQISDDGTVLGVSKGTPILNNAQEYKSIPQSCALYGQALAIACFCESILLRG